MLGLQLARHLGLPSEGGVRSACPDVFVFPMHAISQLSDGRANRPRRAARRCIVAKVFQAGKYHPPGAIPQIAQSAGIPVGSQEEVSEWIATKGPGAFPRW